MHDFRADRSPPAPSADLLRLTSALKSRYAPSARPHVGTVTWAAYVDSAPACGYLSYTCSNSAEHFSLYSSGVNARGNPLSSSSSIASLICDRDAERCRQNRPTTNRLQRRSHFTPCLDTPGN